MVCESRLELDRLWLADLDVQVDGIAAQPPWLVGRDAGGDLVGLDNIRMLGSARRRQFLDDAAIDTSRRAATPPLNVPDR